MSGDERVGGGKGRAEGGCLKLQSYTLQRNMIESMTERGTIQEKNDIMHKKFTIKQMSKRNCNRRADIRKFSHANHTVCPDLNGITLLCHVF